MRINCRKAFNGGERPFAMKTEHHPTWMRLHGLSLLIVLLALNACHAGEQPAQDTHRKNVERVGGNVAATGELRMWMTVGELRFAMTLTDNSAARAFVAQLPLTLDMAELNGNEKHAHLPKALPTNPIRPGTIHSGDLMLYGADTLVVFYLTFDSSYSYTRLGRVSDPTGLAKALGEGRVRMIFSND